MPRAGTFESSVRFRLDAWTWFFSRRDAGGREVCRDRRQREWRLRKKSNRKIAAAGKPGAVALRPLFGSAVVGPRALSNETRDWASHSPAAASEPSARRCRGTTALPPQLPSPPGKLGEFAGICDATEEAAALERFLSAGQRGKLQKDIETYLAELRKNTKPK